MADLKVSSFKFRRNKGGNSIVKFSDGRTVTLYPGDTVDVPAHERTLLAKMNPKQNDLSLYTLVGEGAMAQIKSKEKAEEKLEKVLNPPLDKEEGTGLTMEEANPGWFNVFNGDGVKVNTTMLRKEKAEELVKGSAPSD